MINKTFPNQDYLVITAVWAPAKQVYEHLTKRIPENDSSQWDMREGVFSADDAFVGEPPPGGVHKKRVVAFSTQPEQFTFFTANLQDGWNSLAFRMTSLLQTKALILRFCADHLEYPARSFSWVVKGKLMRHVSVLFEDKWVFCDQGMPLEQEETSAYKERLIKDRLSNEHLVRLAVSLGVPLKATERPIGAGMLFSQI